jgi:hypothetical protein
LSTLQISNFIRCRLDVSDKIKHFVKKFRRWECLMSHLNSDSDAVLRMRTLSLPVLSRSDILKDKVSRKPMGEARKQHTCDFNLTTSPNNVLLFWIIQFLLNYAKMADFFVLIRDSRRKVTEKDRRQTAIRLIYSHRNLQDSLFNRKSNYLLMEKFKFMLITLIR